MRLGSEKVRVHYQRPSGSDETLLCGNAGCTLRILPLGLESECPTFAVPTDRSSPVG